MSQDIQNESKSDKEERQKANYVEKFQRTVCID